MNTYEHSITLHDLTTRELLNAISKAHNGYDDPVYVGHRFVEGGQRVNVWATLDEIRYALTCRPHVPSKKESQVIRQLKAKTKQSEEWLRSHPKYGQEIADACYPNRREVSAVEYVQHKQWYGSWVDHFFKIKQES